MAPLAPLGHVGIVGGGQLARMMVEAASPLGIDVSVLAADASEGAGQVTPRTVVGDWEDLETLRSFAADVDVVTFDHELVPAAVVTDLEAHGAVLRPGPRALGVASDKARERTELAALGLPLPRHEVVRSAAEVTTFAREVGFPVVAKATTGGYDGRGVWWLASDEEAEALFGSLPPDALLLVEPALDLEAELAAIVVRSPSGEMRSYPVVRTTQVDGICVTVEVPSGLDPGLDADARDAARTISEAIGMVGSLAVEMFVVGGQLLVNELAPRPHNSGHLTIEACVTSQFENHLRAVLDLPLGSTELAVPAAAMANVIPSGDVLGPVRDALADPDAHLHLYGKRPRRARKVGHVTVCGGDVDEARRRAEAVARGLADPTLEEVAG